VRLADLDSIALRQQGLVALDQTGWSRGTWYRAIRNGSLEQVHPAVARCIGTEDTELQRIRAASLAVPRAVVSHRSAAVLWGLVSAARGQPVHLTTPWGDAHRRALVGVVCHRPDDLVDVRAVGRHGIATTPPLRTLLDLGVTDPHLVSGAVGRALADKLLTIDGLEAGLGRHAKQGRTGVVVLRRAIDEWALDARPADSILEAAFAQLCERASLPPFVHHQRVEGWEVDFRFVGTPVIVECDGWTTHGRDRDQFEIDRRKDDDLRAAGWVPARLTYRAITRRPADTARRLRRLLDRWSGVPIPDAA